MTVASLTELSVAQLGLNGWIEVDGKKAPIYSMTHLKDQRTTRCFIEARNNATFTVHARHEPSKLSTDMAADVFVDGAMMAGTVIALDSPHTTHSFTGVRTSETSERAFVFSRPQTTDDADLATHNEAIVRNMGTIQIRFFRVGGMTLVERQYVVPKGDAVLDEKAKKATVSHATTLGQSKTVAGGAKMAYRCIDIDPPEQPYYMFEFRYQSRDLLEINNHVDAKPKVAAPAAGPSGQKRKIETIVIDSDDDSDDEEAQARLRRTKVKAERKEKAAGGTAGKVKDEETVIELD
ncbi:hypothetical protein RQP46_005103 [Phenoliferia psychrophenolica]